MTMIPPVVPPLPHEGRWSRHLAPEAAFDWLAAGWRDLKAEPGTSLFIGFIVFLASGFIVGGLFVFGWDYLLFPTAQAWKH